MVLSLKDALDLYQTQVGIANDLWTFFGTVTLAVLGFTIGSEKATRSGREITIIIAGYFVFAAFGNLPALRQAYTQLGKFSALVDQAAATQKLEPMHLELYSPLQVTVFHLGVTLVVCLAIFVYWQARRRNR